MTQYQVATVCPYCKVVNKMDMFGAKRGFYKGSGAFSTTCTECGKQFKSKAKDLAYLKS